MNVCKNCGGATTNPKYCSRSCSVSINNEIPKRGLRKQCGRCGTRIHSQHRYCENCRTRKPKRNYATATLGELKQDDRLKHPSYYRGHLNAITRVLNKHRPKICEVCGYTTYVEYCHIAPVASFPPEATLAQVSGPDNIRILCPNHHWEFDHDLLENVAQTGFQPVA